MKLRFATLIVLVTELDFETRDNFSDIHSSFLQVTSKNIFVVMYACKIWNQNSVPYHQWTELIYETLASTFMFPI
jgi:hypothetical protein